MNLIRDLARTFLRFIVVWIVDTASLLLTAVLVPGIRFTGDRNLLVVATSAAFLLGIVNFLIRPLILLLALPFGFIAIFLVGLFLNAVALVITANILPGLVVSSWLDAFFGSIVLAALNTVLTSIIAVDDDNSFYVNLAERLASRESYFEQDSSQGIILMEIDGLSYHHIRKAIAEGWMPTLRRMMREDGYVLSRFDCGLPSQTSACQAGIMFGDNFDIPAFRWFDKDEGRMIVSGHDAPWINARHAKGNGLMRAGSSVNNMLNGDARISILTLADLFQASEEQQRRRAQDFYLLMLNPYFLMRTLVLYLADVFRELFEATLQQLRREAPRLNRFAHFYPFIRAATTVLMRDVSAYLTILEIVRGTPALYVTWPGYDEVAHHSGPWTHDAFHTLSQYDKVIARVRETIERKAPRPYELIILSDHGQSYGWTFKQRYGKSLKEYIEEILPQGASVTQSAGGDDGMMSVNAMALELDNVQNQNMGGRIGKRVVRNARRVVQRGVRAHEGGGMTPPAPPSGDGSEKPAAPQVTVCASGNLAQVYFDLAPRRLKLSEINAAHSGLVDALVRHEGIGIVMAYDDDGQAIAFGKKGAHNVHTGAVVGEDPLTMYGDPQLRAAQLRRLADFPHNGDLTVISTFYPDGTVAAMEELVGNHGGLGGEQTDAFIFHPPDFQVPAITNSAEVFQVLNARRGLVVSRAEGADKERQLDAWSPRNLWTGLTRVRRWVPVALRAIVLDRWAYRRAAFDPFMTAPALVIAALAALLAAWYTRGALDPVEWGRQFAAWLVGTLLVFGAARLLRGKSSFTTTLRAVGLAQGAHVIALLILITPIAALGRIAAYFVVFLGTWIGVSEAHKLHGWRTLLLPVVFFVLATFSALALDILLRGTEMAVTDLVRALGLLPLP